MNELQQTKSTYTHAKKKIYPEHTNINLTLLVIRKRMNNLTLRNVKQNSTSEYSGLAMAIYAHTFIK